MSQIEHESKRITKLKKEIIKAIPKFPNNRDTVKILEGFSLRELLLYYLNWNYRFVPQRPRSIHIFEAAKSNTRWKDYAQEIHLLLNKAKNGEDLYPHLSLKAHNKAFTPNTTKKDVGVDKWEDKDFLLTIMGHHHFHLSSKIEAKGYSSRTDDVLFARV